MNKPFWIGKKYKHQTYSKNYDDYLKAIGIGAINRKLGVLLRPTIYFTVDDDGVWTCTILVIPGRTQVCTFKLGEEFEEVTVDGRKFKTVFTLEDDNTLIQVQKGAKNMTVVRKFTEEEMNSTCSVDDIECSVVSKFVGDI